jgi:hypothetical protein
MDQTWLSLIVWQLGPYVRTNRNHKQTWILNSGCTPLACAFKHQKSRLSPLYPDDPSLMTFLSSNLENKQILFSLHQLPKCRLWIDSGYVKEPIQLGIQVLQPPKFGNFTNYRDILRPYEIGIGAYSKVNIKSETTFLIN